MDFQRPALRVAQECKSGAATGALLRGKIRHEAENLVV